MQRAAGRVICLVRADSPQHALVRLKASLKAHAVWSEDWEKRLVMVPGDLSLPRFGLDETQFLELARSVDTILHNGAFLHWLHPYKTLAPANVLGTQEVQTPHLHTTLKALHHQLIVSYSGSSSVVQ